MWVISLDNLGEIYCALLIILSTCFILIFVHFIMMLWCPYLVWWFWQRMERTETIDNFKVGSLPTLIYIPDFITDNEQTMLLNKVEIHICLTYSILLSQCFIFLVKILSMLAPLLYRYMKPLYRSGNL